jgi:hypothetical protein
VCPGAANDGWYPRRLPPPSHLPYRQSNLRSRRRSLPVRSRSEKATTGVPQASASSHRRRVGRSADGRASSLTGGARAVMIFHHLDHMRHSRKPGRAAVKRMPCPRECQREVLAGGPLAQSSRRCQVPGSLGPPCTLRNSNAGPLEGEATARTLFCSPSSRTTLGMQTYSAPARILKPT